MKQVVVEGQFWSFEKFEGQNPPLLILHGWGRSKEEWIRLGKELSVSTGRSIYCLDLPGFGGSSLPKVKTLGDYVELLVRWLEYMKVKRVGIIGHSLGGRVGLYLTSHHPELVERIALIAPAGVKSASLRRDILGIISKLVAWIPEKLRRKLGEMMMDEDYRNSPSLRNLYRVVVGEDLRRLLARINCQVGVIWGERDLILPIKLTKLYSKLLPYPTIKIIWEAGHDPHLTHYELLKRAVEETWI